MQKMDVVLHNRLTGIFQVVFVLSVVAQLVSGDVTFGSCPNKCTCENDNDGKLVIDCADADYDYVPVTSIPCNAKKLLFINNNLQ